MSIKTNQILVIIQVEILIMSTNEMNVQKARRMKQLKFFLVNKSSN